jgi:hypothetical protein
MSLLRQGSRGPDVVALQRALNRQLFPSHNLAEDGIFGSKTKAAVIAFQRQAGIDIDGLVGPQTRAALGIPNPGTFYTHKVRLHFRSLTLTDVPFSRILSSAQQVYHKYGIKIEYASGMSLNLSEEEAKKFEQLDGTCNWRINNGEYAELQRMGGGVPNNEIAVFVVKNFSEAIRGCGGHLPNRPACFIAADGTRWTCAHEVGHVLLTSAFSPVHSSDTNNLMLSSTSSITTTDPELSAAQLTQMKASPCCQSI